MGWSASGLVAFVAAATGCEAIADLDRSFEVAPDAGVTLETIDGGSSPTPDATATTPPDATMATAPDSGPASPHDAGTTEASTAAAACSAPGWQLDCTFGNGGVLVLPTPAGEPSSLVFLGGVSVAVNDLGAVMTVASSSGEPFLSSMTLWDPVVFFTNASQETVAEVFHGLGQALDVQSDDDGGVAFLVGSNLVSQSFAQIESVADGAATTLFEQSSSPENEMIHPVRFADIPAGGRGAFFVDSMTTANSKSLHVANNEGAVTLYAPSSDALDGTGFAASTQGGLGSSPPVQIQVVPSSIGHSSRLTRSARSRCLFRHARLSGPD